MYISAEVWNLILVLSCNIISGKVTYILPIKFSGLISLATFENQLNLCSNRKQRIKLFDKMSLREIQ